MNRFATGCLTAALLAGWVGADAPTGPGPAEQAKLFHRNRVVIQELVSGGLDLAAEPSALKRAERCNRLARALADEVQQAARDREPARAVEMAGHLRELVERGVAANLARARETTKPGSQDEKALAGLRDQAQRVLLPADEILPLAGPAAHQAELRRSQAELRSAGKRLDEVVGRKGE